MRFQLKKIALGCLLATLGASAFSANYFFVTPKSMEMSKTSPLSVSLNPRALPEAVVGKPYNAGEGFDFKSVLAVSGDSGFNPALTTFSITSGALPMGLIVSAAGVLSGTPTLASAGSSIQVTAAYKTASGSQTYQVISTKPLQYAVISVSYSSYMQITQEGLLVTAGAGSSGTSSSYATARANVGLSTGKHYWELKHASNAPTGWNQYGCGIAPVNGLLSQLPGYNMPNAYGFNFYGVTPLGIIEGCALDLVLNKLSWYRSGSLQATIDVLPGTYFPTVSGYNGDSYLMNFGQVPFVYAPPSGFTAGVPIL